MRRLLQNIVDSIQIPQDKVEFNDTWFLWDGYYRTIIKFFARLEIKYNVFLHKQEHFTCNPKSSIIKRNSIFLATNILYIDLTIFLCTRRTGHKGHSRSASVGGAGGGCTPKRGWVVLSIQYIGRLTILGSVGLRHFCHGQCQPHIRCKDIFRYRNIKF